MNGVNIMVIKQLRKFDPEGKHRLIEGLAELYLKSAPIAVQEIEVAIANRDIEEIGRIAHRFKNTNRTLGLEGLACLLGNLEAKTKEVTHHALDWIDVDQMLGDIALESRNSLKVVEQLAVSPCFLNRE